MALDVHTLALEIDLKAFNAALKKANDLVETLQDRLNKTIGPALTRSFETTAISANAYAKELSTITTEASAAAVATEDNIQATEKQSKAFKILRNVARGASLALATIGVGLLGAKGLIVAAQKYGFSLETLAAQTRILSAAARGASAMMSALIGDRQVRAALFFSRRFAMGMSGIVGAANRASKALTRIEVPARLIDSTSQQAAAVRATVDAHNAGVASFQRLFKQAARIGALLAVLGSLGFALTSSAKGLNNLGKAIKGTAEDSDEAGERVRKFVKGLGQLAIAAGGVFATFKLGLPVLQRFAPQVVENLQGAFTRTAAFISRAGILVAGFAAAAKTHAVAYGTALATGLKAELPKIIPVVSSGLARALTLVGVAKTSARGFATRFTTTLVAGIAAGAGALRSFGVSLVNRLRGITTQTSTVIAGVAGIGVAAAAGSPQITRASKVYQAFGASLKAVLPILVALWGFIGEIAVSNILKIIGDGFSRLGTKLQDTSKLWVQAAADMESAVFALQAGITATSQDMDEVIPRTARWQKELRELAIATGANLSALTLASARTLDLARAFKISDDAMLPLINRSADFGAAVKRNIEDVLRAVVLAMQGIPGPARRMGLALTENEINASEFAVSLGRTVKTMTQSEKAMAFVSAFMEQTAKFTGAAAAAQQTFNQQLKTAANRWEIVNQAMGQGVLIFQQFLVGPGAAFAGFIAETPPAILKFTGALTFLTGGALRLLGAFIKVTATLLTTIAIVRLATKVYAFLTISVNGFTAAIGRETAALGGLNVMLVGTIARLKAFTVATAGAARVQALATAFRAGGIIATFRALIAVLGPIVLLFAKWIAIIGGVIVAVVAISRTLKQAVIETGAWQAAVVRIDASLRAFGTSIEGVRTILGNFLRVLVRSTKLAFKQFVVLSTLLATALPAAFSKGTEKATAVVRGVLKRFGIELGDSLLEGIEELSAALPDFWERLLKGTFGDEAVTRRASREFIGDLKDDLKKGLEEVRESLEGDPVIPSTGILIADDVFTGIEQFVRDFEGQTVKLGDIIDRVPQLGEVISANEVQAQKLRLVALRSEFDKFREGLSTVVAESAKATQAAIEHGASQEELEEIARSARFELTKSVDTLAKLRKEINQITPAIEKMASVAGAAFPSIRARTLALLDPLKQLETRVGRTSREFQEAVLNMASSFQSAQKLIFPAEEIEQRIDRVIEETRDFARQLAVQLNKAGFKALSKSILEATSLMSKAFDETAVAAREFFDLTPSERLKQEAMAIRNLFLRVAESGAFSAAQLEAAFENKVLPKLKEAGLAIDTELLGKLQEWRAVSLQATAAFIEASSSQQNQAAMAANQVQELINEQNSAALSVSAFRDKVIEAGRSGELAWSRVAAALQEKVIPAFNETGQAIDSGIRMALLRAREEVIRTQQDALDYANTWQSVGISLREQWVRIQNNFGNLTRTMSDLLDQSVSSFVQGSASAFTDLILNIRQTEQVMDEATGQMVTVTKSRTQQMSDAFAAMARDIIREITRMVTQMLIFQALQASIGGFSRGGVVGGARGTIFTGGTAGPPTPGLVQKGGVVPGAGNKDSMPALLTPGEVVIPKNMVGTLASAISLFQAATGKGRGLISVLGRTAGAGTPMPRVPRLPGLQRGGVVPGSRITSGAATSTPTTDVGATEFTIVNVTDKSLIFEAMASAAGRNIVLNTLRAGAVRQASPQRFIARGFQ